MKTQTLTSVLALTLLTACGGSGGGNNLPADRPAPDNPNTPAPQSTDTVDLGDIQLPPYAVARPSADIRKETDEALALVNRERAEKGLAPLRYNESLAAYASVRAQELATLNAHKRPNGDNPLSEYTLTGGGNNAAVGESIATGSPYAKDTVAQWRNSPNHYKSMTDAAYTDTGIGYYYHASNQYRHHWAEIFGSSGIRSRYYYIAPLDAAAIRAAVAGHTGYDANGRLSLHGMENAAGTGQSGQNRGIYSTAQSLALDSEHTLILCPHQAAGWSYQTFGEIAATRSGIPEAYLNVGKPFIPADNATLRADYKGSAIGDINQSSRAIADVSARVDYGSNSKTLTLTLGNSQSGNLDGSNLHRDARLDFTDTLHWDSGTQRFQSDNGHARLYGQDGEELGGQFSRSISGGADYRGVYGAKRVGP
ncbi:CAP domain-containing protein [uncultured Cardiobacterium sp.]|uniref:CAP domain-containing protein n=1 Tax=uncultured Cardiobacterium sp. TaxID=417619 RepID=UPI0026282B01|nr:CAP domain-containing protein [uncultured Cardiobacterium sp.]